MVHVSDMPLMDECRATPLLELRTSMHHSDRPAALRHARTHFHAVGWLLAPCICVRSPETVTAGAVKGHRAAPRRPRLLGGALVHFIVEHSRREMVYHSVRCEGDGLY